MIYEEPSVTMIGSAGLEPLWPEPSELPGPPSILSWDGRGLLLWVTPAEKDPRAILLDPITGTRRWITPTISDRLGEPLPRRLGRGEVAVMPMGQPFDPGETLPLVGSENLVVVRRSGEAIAFDLQDGQRVIWQRVQDRPLHQVHLAQLHDFGLVLTGLRRPVDTREQVPAIVVLDPATGRLLREIKPLGDSVVSWMTITTLGSLVYGTAHGVEMLDLVTGVVQATNVSAAARKTSRGWQVGGHIVLERRSARRVDGPSPLQSIRLADGVL